MNYSMNTDYARSYSNITNQSTQNVSGGLNSTNVQKAVSDMNQDQELKEFSVFVPSGQVPEAARYQEDWMRPSENFAL